MNSCLGSVWPYEPRGTGKNGYYDVSAGEAEQAANLRITLRQQGRQLEAIDSMLAIIALRNDLTLLTTDKDFQAVPGLKQENWLVG